VLNFDAIGRVYIWILVVLIMPEISALSPGLSSARHVLVIQPLVGIGDMIWHKPWIDELARTHKVTLMTKPTVQAEVIFEGAPANFSVLRLERSIRGRRGRHDGPIGFFRLVSDMRATGADTAVILHASPRYALAARLAGITWRLGYGIGRQKRHLNAGHYLEFAALKMHAIDRVRRFAELNGFGVKDPVWSVQPRGPALAEAKRLLVSWGLMPDRQTGPQTGRQTDPQRAARFLCIGIGSMNPERQWGAARFAELITQLAQHRPDLSCLILGGPGERELAEQITSRLQKDGLSAPVFLGKLDEAVGLMTLSGGYVGNDTGLLNFMVCCDKPVLGLFSHSPPLTYSPNLHKTEAVKDDEFGQPEIIQKITPVHVLDKINSLWPAAEKIT